MAENTISNQRQTILDCLQRISCILGNDSCNTLQALIRNPPTNELADKVLQFYNITLITNRTRWIIIDVFNRMKKGTPITTHLFGHGILRVSNKVDTYFDIDISDTSFDASSQSVQWMT